MKMSKCARDVLCQRFLTCFFFFLVHFVVNNNKYSLCRYTKVIWKTRESWAGTNYARLDPEKRKSKKMTDQELVLLLKVNQNVYKCISNKSHRVWYLYL